MPKRRSWKTVDERAELLKDMYFLAKLDSENFAFMQPFGPEDKTPYRTQNTEVKIRPSKKGKRPIENKAVELQIDLNIALNAGDFKGALEPYFKLNALLGG